MSKTNSCDKHLMKKLSKCMYENMMMMSMVEAEIMELYEIQFGVSALDTSTGVFSRNEQIERIAQNIYFWKKLNDEYNNVNEMDKIKIPRYRYICSKRDEFNMSIYKKYYKTEPSLIEAIQKRVSEIV
jgi:hypothetical protein